MNTVDIAMATYNGEKYISEQIDSIINQSYQDWRLYISDDGSTDDTVKIVKTFVSKDDRIILINTERQGGVIPNFNKALEHTSAGFIALSDQDDIWPVNRLEILVNEISKNNEVNQPQLIFTDLTLVDEDGVVISESFYRGSGINPLENLEGYNLLWKCTIYGCTTIMNRALLDITLPIPLNAHMHDQWLSMIAHQSNGLKYLDYANIFYRQHEDNVVGGKNRSFLDRLLNAKQSASNLFTKAENTKSYLKQHDGLYFQDRPFKTCKDFFKFTLVEIIPNIFKTKKKVQTLVFLTGFLLSK